MLPGDLKLFLVGIAGEFNHFHPIQQRPWNRIGGIGCRNEEHFGKIERDFQKMITKTAVLLRVQRLKQRRRRVAAVVRSQFVDFVQHHERIAAFRLNDPVNDAPRHGADVGFAMTANLRLVMDAAQRDAHQFASGRPGDTHGNTGFPGARRAHQAEHSAANIRSKAAYRQILQDPFFHLFQPVVVLVQHFPRQREILHFFRGFPPRQFQADIDITAQHRRFRRAESLFAQAAEFLFQFFAHFLRASQTVDSFGIFREIVHLVLFAKFRLNSPKFLPQEVFPLIFHHLFLCLRRQFLFNLQHLNFSAQKPVQHHKAAAGVVALQDLLFVFGSKLSVLCDKPCDVLIARV